MSERNRSLFFLLLTCNWLCIFANDVNIKACAKQRTLDITLQYFVARNYTIAEGKYDFWFYSKIIGAGDNVTVFFNNGNDNNRFKQTSFTWQYDIDKGDPTLVILIMKGEKPEQPDEGTMRKVMEEYVKVQRFADDTDDVSIECFWMKHSLLSIVQNDFADWYGKFERNDSNCRKSRNSAENIVIHFALFVDITSKKCPTVAESTSTATTTRTSRPPALLRSLLSSTADSDAYTTTSANEANTDKTNETTAETKATIAEDGCNLWVSIAALVILSMVVIVIVLFLWWYKKYILNTSLPLLHHQISIIPLISEQQQLDSVTLRTLNKTGESKSLGRAESSKTVHTKQASDTTTLNIRPNSSTIRSLSSRIQKAKRMKSGSMSYHETTSKDETMPTNAETPKGIVECMNPRDTDHDPPKDVQSDPKPAKLCQFHP